MSVRVTWWGHATVTVELGGVRVLTDPVLTARVAHLVRLGGAVPGPEAACADVVLVSHLHADHLHLPSLRAIPPGSRLVLPTGGVGLAERAWRGPVLPVEPTTAVTIGDRLTVTAVRARHDGRRHPVSRHHGTAVGYLLEADGRRVWFAGDTGWFPELAELAPVDVALVPVGGWGPTLGPHHLDPEQAAEAVAAVQARHAVPIHFGTLWPAGLRPVARSLFDRRFRQPGCRFAAAVERRGLPTEVHVLDCGASVTL